MIESKKCLVLGANGFIGSHLVDRLADEGYEVIAADRFSGRRRYKESPLVTEAKCDLLHVEELETYIKNANYVFHCFSATTPFSADNDPYIDITHNLLNNVHIFELCAKHAVKKVVYISSGGSVYGEDGEKETDATAPVSPYAIAKLATERYLAYFKKKYGLDYIVYRLSNPYGPRQVTKQNQGVIPLFIHKISAGEPIVMYGDGTSSRDYIYIEDASRLMVNSFARANQHEVYNLGSGKQTSLQDIVRTIESLCDKKAKIEHVAEPPTFIKTAHLDTSRIEQEFGIKANTDLSTGIARTLDYIRANS